MKIKKFISVTLGLICVLCLGSLLLMGCNNDPVTFKVTIANFNMVYGTVSLDKKDGVYESGAEVTVSVATNEGYILDSFTVDGEDKLNSLDNGVYKFTIQKDVTISVGFKKDETNPDDNKEPDENSFVVTVESAENGSLTLSSGKTSFKEGEEATVMIRPNKGYEIESFFVGEDDYTRQALLDGEYAFKVTSDITVSATFVPDDLTVTQDVSVKGFGRITDNNEYVLVDFWATWCVACVEYTEPEVKKLAKEDLGIKIVKMDIGAVNENPPEREFFFKYTQMYGNYNTIPAFVLFKNGQPIDGIYSESSFGYTVDQLREFVLKNIESANS